MEQGCYPAELAQDTVVFVPISKIRPIALLYSRWRDLNTSVLRNNRYVLRLNCILDYAEPSDDHPNAAKVIALHMHALRSSSTQVMPPNSQSVTFSMPVHKESERIILGRKGGKNIIRATLKP